MEVSLRWRGPIGIGKFTPEHLKQAYGPGVYFRLKLYRDNLFAIYVGKADYVISRIDVHLRDILGLNFKGRDANGRDILPYGFENRFACFNDIDTYFPIALAEAKRSDFYYALCDGDFDVGSVSDVEAALVRWLFEMRQANRTTVIVENERQPSGGVGWTFLHDFSRAEPTESGKILMSLLGVPQPSR